MIPSVGQEVERGSLGISLVGVQTSTIQWRETWQYFKAIIKHIASDTTTSGYIFGETFPLIKRGSEQEWWTRIVYVSAKLKLICMLISMRTDEKNALE